MKRHQPGTNTIISSPKCIKLLVKLLVTSEHQTTQVFTICIIQIHYKHGYINMYGQWSKH